MARPRWRASSLGACAGTTRVADLFSGIGPFALRVAESTRFAADNDEKQALTALKRAAGSTAGLKPVQVERGDLFRRPLAGRS